MQHFVSMILSGYHPGSILRQTCHLHKDRIGVRGSGRMCRENWRLADACYLATERTLSESPALVVLLCNRQLVSAAQRPYLDVNSSSAGRRSMTTGELDMLQGAALLSHDIFATGA